MFFFFFKQKTAYEMRISDWSSDVCSSDLIAASMLLPPCFRTSAPASTASGCGATIMPRAISPRSIVWIANCCVQRGQYVAPAGAMRRHRDRNESVDGAGRGHIPSDSANEDRKSVVWGKSVSVGGDPGGSRRMK